MKLIFLFVSHSFYQVINHIYWWNVQKRYPSFSVDSQRTVLLSYFPTHPIPAIYAPQADLDKTTKHTVELKNVKIKPKLTIRVKNVFVFSRLGEMMSFQWDSDKGKDKGRDADMRLYIAFNNGNGT